MLLPLILSTAMAHESDPQEVNIDETVTIVQNQGVDSGWIPNSGAVSLRLEILANQEADVQMDGDGSLEWPEDLQLTLDGDSDAASVTLDTSLDSTVSLKFDIAGYQYEQPIINRTLSFDDTAVFAPFSLGETQTINSVYDGDPSLSFNQKVLFVVDVIFAGTISPTCTTTFTGLHWDVGGQQVSQNSSSYEAIAGAPYFDSQAVYNAELSSNCTIDFVPSVSVCVPLLDCVEWEVGTFPLDDVNATVNHAFNPNQLSFPLPSAEVISSLDFGTVELGSTNNLELDINNVGALLLQGDAQIDDTSGVFSALGSEIYIPGGESDSIVISFSSDQEGAHGATIELVTNDPANPIQTIELTATVVSEEEFEELVDGDGAGKIEEGCGCSASSAPERLGLWLLLPAAMMIRRRSA